MDDRDEVEALRAEVSALEQRVAELEAKNVQSAPVAAGYRALFHGSPNAMALTDPGGRFLDVNASFERFLGYSVAELRGVSSDDISHPDDIPVSRTLFAAMAHGARDTVDLEKRFRRKDGTWVWARVHASFARDAEGNILSGCSMVKDVEEDLKTATSVRAVEARNRALLDAVPDLLFVMSPDGRFLDCKPARDVALFLPPSTFLGRRITEALPLESSRRHADIIRDVADTGESRIDVYDMPGPDGITYYEGYFSRASTGEVVVSIRDVTKRVAAERERDRLAQAVGAQVNELRRWKTLADRAPDGIALVDLEGTVAYTNAAFQELLASGSLVGKSIRKILARPEEALTLQETLGEQGHSRSEIVLVREDGSHFLGQGVMFLVTNEDGTPTGYGSIVRDRSEEQRAEEERLKLREQLIDAQEALIRELETPLLPVGKGVLVMPLVGRVDAARADRLTGTLLEGISAHSARVVIIDITGVPVVDAAVAEALVRVAAAVRLLGAETLLTGVRAAVAQALVLHAAEISGLRPCSTLERGVTIALKQCRDGRGALRGSSRGG